MTASDKTKDGGSHTPGPWVARRMYTGGFDIFDPRNRDVVTVYGGGVETESREANARLIAAAPDGLAFAQHYDAYMSANYSEGPSSSALHPTAAETWRLARSFISKATGDA